MATHRLAGSPCACVIYGRSGINRRPEKTFHSERLFDPYRATTLRQGHVGARRRVVSVVPRGSKRSLTAERVTPNGSPMAVTVPPVLAKPPHLFDVRGTYLARRAQLGHVPRRGCVRPFLLQELGRRPNLVNDSLKSAKMI